MDDTQERDKKGSQTYFKMFHLTHREVEIGATLRYHFSPVRLTKKKSMMALPVGEATQKLALPHVAGGGARDTRKSGNT